MYRSRNSIIAILGLLTLIGVTVCRRTAHTGSGQALQGNGAVQLNWRRETVRCGGARSCSLPMTAI